MNNICVLLTGIPYVEVKFSTTVGNAWKQFQEHGAAKNQTLVFTPERQGTDLTPWLPISAIPLKNTHPPC